MRYENPLIYYFYRHKLCDLDARWRDRHSCLFYINIMVNM